MVKSLLVKSALVVILALEFYAIDNIYNFEFLVPPADPYCTSNGGHLVPDINGGWWCKYQNNQGNESPIIVQPSSGSRRTE